MEENKINSVFESTFGIKWEQILMNLPLLIGNRDKTVNFELILVKNEEIN